MQHFPSSYTVTTAYVKVVVSIVGNDINLQILGQRNISVYMNRVLI